MITGYNGDVAHAEAVGIPGCLSLRLVAWAENYTTDICAIQLAANLYM